MPLLSLAEKVGLSERSAYRTVKLLKQHNWARVEKQGSTSVLIPIMPQAEDERRTKVLKDCIAVAQYRGEFILGAILSTGIIMEGRVDHARPAFLKSPLSEGKLEYDVFSPVTMDALELNGFQHSGPTETQPSVKKAREQEANDLMKIGRSAENGVNLLVLTYKDLSLDGVLRKLPGHLPRRPIDRKSKYVRTLESIAGNYREWCSRKETALIAKRKEREMEELRKAASLGEIRPVPDGD